MPRTIDSIMDAHDTATARRKAGKPVWDRTVRIKHHLTREDASFEEIRDRVAGALRASTWVKSKDPIKDGYGLLSAIEELEESVDAQEFDYFLDRVYDEADYDRVWIA